VRVEHGGGPADRRQPPPLYQGVPDDPQHQAVRGDGLAVQAEGQERGLRQPRQRRIHHARRHHLVPAVSQGARLTGLVQQLPADPGRRQHRHQLHHPRTHPALVPGPDRGQGQKHRPGP